MTCIVCPNGCELDITINGEDINVEGAQCKKGITFAHEEIKAPKRSISTTVQTVFGDMPRIPVKTAGEIPKEHIFEAVDIIKKIKVTQRLKAGDVLLEDVFGSKIICTQTM